MMTDSINQNGMKNQRADKCALRSFFWGLVVGMVVSPRNFFEMVDYHLVAPTVLTKSLSSSMTFQSQSSSSSSSDIQQISNITESVNASAVSTSSTKSGNMWKTLAPSFLPINPETGKILLPETIQTIVLDIGARRSDYLSALEATMDDTVALFLFDPQPDSYIPLTQRTAAYAMDNDESAGFNLHPTRSRQVFVLPVALGPTETQTTFQIAQGPACGSLLPNNVAAGFWCNDAKERIQANVITLESFLELLPENSNQTIHLKVDAEGYDLEVVRGAGTALQQLETIIMECQDLNATDVTLFREGGCRVDEALPFLEHHGFVVSWKVQGKQGNLYARKNRSSDVVMTAMTHQIPAFLTHPKIEYHDWYGSFNPTA